MAYDILPSYQVLAVGLAGSCSAQSDSNVPSSVLVFHNLNVNATRRNVTLPYHYPDSYRALRRTRLFPLFDYHILLPPRGNIGQR